MLFINTKGLFGLIAESISCHWRGMTRTGAAHIRQRPMPATARSHDSMRSARTLNV